MGADVKDFPEHVQRQIREKDARSRKTVNRALQAVKVKAAPHDDRMNKTERNYAGYLEKLKLNGDIIDWAHEPFNLRLADRTFYKPDFIVITSDRTIEIHEVKGHWQDDALVKIKVAAENHPWFTFRAVFHEKGFWKYRDFKSQKAGY